MPEVKRFLYESVLQKEYEDLHVSFIPGATPELVLYGPNKEVLSREVIRDMSFDELHAFVQAKGFKHIRKEDPAEEETEAEKTMAADDYNYLPDGEEDTADLSAYEDAAEADHQEL